MAELYVRFLNVCRDVINSALNIISTSTSGSNALARYEHGWHIVNALFYLLIPISLFGNIGPHLQCLQDTALV